MPSPIKNVHGSTLDFLGAGIVAGRYPQGSGLPAEPVMGESLGVSRTVVREAVKSLVAKGMVSTGPKVGTRVLQADQWNLFDADVIRWHVSEGLTNAFLRDSQDLRRIVEPAAVRLAALRASPEQIAQLRAAFVGMVAAVNGQGDYLVHDLRFHQTLLQASGNRLLVQMSKALSALLRTSFEISTRVAFGPAGSLAMHEAVLNAVAAHDPDLAELAVIRLIDSAHDDIAHVLHPAPVVEMPPKITKRRTAHATVD